MVTYRLQILLRYVLAILVAIFVLAVPYSLLFNTAAMDRISQFSSPTQAIGFSIIAATASIFAIMEALVSWLKSWRENRIKSELVQVINALCTAPVGMDITALERESKLPTKVLQERVNELILLGRIGVRITANNHREYFLVGV